MILNVMTRETNAIQYACAKVDLNCMLIPTEFQGIVRVRISDWGKEISPELAWRLCALTQAKIDVDNRAERQELPFIRK